MTSFKSALSLVAVALVIAAITVSSSPISSEEDYSPETFAVNKSNHLVVGNRQYGDKIIYSENIEEKFLITGKKLILNRTILAPNNYVITQVRALDKITDGTGAEPIVTGGGPDLTWVSLRFKSQRWHGIYFIVEVYARPR
ncbi:probable salivary secreted peptide [Nasonia vitripennis]|uniref:Salivary secreted peptide n=1 Tax=Nasonia vitripennis TaxID=7425 RepID=A0A7M7GE84_NASVI|nr:probable salivary secreted peptide [Nasonia vitripennis]